MSTVVYRSTVGIYPFGDVVHKLVLSGYPGFIINTWLIEATEIMTEADSSDRE